MKEVNMDIAEMVRLLSSRPANERMKTRYLKDRVQVLEGLLSRLEEIVFIYDIVNNRTLWTNGNYSKILGYREDDILQYGLENLSSFLHPEDFKLILEGFKMIRSGHEDSFSRVYRVLHKEGHWVYMLCQFSILQRDESGIPKYVLVTAIDFTKQIQSEKQLHDLIAEYRQLSNNIRLNCLTPREKEIIKNLTLGMTCKEISHHLGISFYTAETHIRNIHQKLGLNNLSALINFAVKNGLSA